MDAPFLKICQVVSQPFNSEYRQQQLLSQMQAARLKKLMNEHNNDLPFDGLEEIVI